MRMSAFERFRSVALNSSKRLEGGEYYSATARWIMKHRLGVSIGTYSYGECFVPGAFPSGVTIGRYVSIGPGVRAFLRNHPMERLSLHPFFYNRQLGFVKEDNISSTLLEIGHDAWIGARAMIMPGCSRIGIGAVVGAGAIVTKDVPDFAIAVGNPAKVIRRRFSDSICEDILRSRWWENSVDVCVKHMPAMTTPLGETTGSHPLLQPHSQP